MNITENSFFNSFIENSEDLISRIDQDGRILYVNPASLKFWGISQSECIGLPVQNFIHPDDKKNTLETFQSWLSNGDDKIEYENRQIHTNGSFKHTLWTINTIKNDDGKVTELWCTSRDVTEKKIIEDVQTFIAQKKWHNTDSNFLNALVTYLATTLNVDYALIDTLTDDPLIVETVSLYAMGSIQNNVTYSLEGTPCANVIGKNICSYECNIQKHFPDDTLLTEMSAESYVGIPLWNSEGHPIGLIAILDRKPIENIDFCKTVFQLVAVRAASELENLIKEKKLKEERDKAQSYLDIAQVILVALDNDSNITMINEKGLEILGYTKSELIGENWTRLTQTNDAKEIINSENETFYNESTITSKDKSSHLIAWRSTNIKDERGVTIGTLKSGEDITETKNLEAKLRQSEKLQAIGELAGGVAHDFNNQLGAIIGFADLITESNDIQRTKLFASKIMTASRRATDLTKQLLAFSRKGDIIKKAIDIHEVINEVIGILKHTIDKKIQLSKHLNSQTSVILGDPSMIQNVLMNLAINSRDAMPDGGTLSIQTQDMFLDDQFCNNNSYGISPGMYIQVSVSDTGVGISDDIKQKIFDPFFTTKEIGKGTGMGLSAAYGTMRNQGGAISVYSEIGHGTTMKLYFPVNNSPKIEVSPENFSDNTVKGVGTLLVVDDEELLLEYCETMLKSLGYNVILASNGLEAIEYYKDNWRNIDLVILDMIMPTMDGKTTFKQMQNINPEIVALICSGYNINGSVQECLNDGVKGFIQKPFQKIELSKAIAHHLNS